MGPAFSLLSDELEREVVGRTYPQVQQLGGGAYWRLDVSERLRLLQEAARATAPPNLGSLFLEPGAKLTDNVSAAVLSNGLLLSARAAEIFRAHALGPRAFCPATVVDSKLRDHQYFWLELGNDDSSLERTQPDFRVEFESGKEERVSSFRAALRALDPWARPPPVVRKFVLPADLVAARDLFAPRIGGGWLVSQRLAVAIQAAKLTGFAVRAAPGFLSVG